MPICACCGVLLPAAGIVVPGIGLCHHHCAWEIERVARDLLVTKLFRDERAAVSLLQWATNEIVVSMAAEWVAMWADSRIGHT